MAGKKKIQRAWSLYDWANSAYNLVITSTIFPAYYIAVTSGNSRGGTSDVVSFFGWRVINTALLNYGLAFAYLIIACLSPVLSAIADYRGNKHRFLQLFCYIGSLSCCLLFFFSPGRVELGVLLAVVAAIGYCGSLVFYNAYLPEIATLDEQHRLSAQGYAYGYVGSVLLQLLCFALVLYPFADATFAPRLSFLLVGIWWIGFAQITFRNLPKSSGAGKQAVGSLLGGFRELRKVWRQVQVQPRLKRYLAAFFCYSMGVQTVMLAAAEFGSKEVKKQVDGRWVPLETEDLILTILVIQLVAIGGAFLMARLATLWGNIKVLMLTVLIWIGICLLAYQTSMIYQFYGVAFLVGLVMGGIQSLSRSTYAGLMPPTRDTASYFSFYDVTEKLAIVCGMFSFGLLEHLTGSMRYSIIALTIFFIVGFFMLIWTNRSSERRVSARMRAAESFQE